MGAVAIMVRNLKSRMEQRGTIQELSRLISLICFISISIVGRPAQAQQASFCPTWIQDPSVPECPQSDNTILDETYPALGHVISDDPMVRSPSSEDFPVQVAMQILMASGERVPILFLATSQVTFERLRQRILDTTQSLPQYWRFRDRWLAAMVSVDARYRWQQDYFESFYNRQTGLPVLREVRDYGRAGNSFSQLVSAAQRSLSCLSPSGNNATTANFVGEALPPLSASRYIFTRSAMGGNVEGLPGGFCLHGNTRGWDDFGQYYCGSRDNEVSVDASWLWIEHVDEFMSVLPHPRSARSENQECPFAIQITSPVLALRLLEERPQDRFFNFFTGTQQVDAAGINQSRTNFDLIQKVCRALRRGSRARPTWGLAQLDCTRAEALVGLTNSQVATLFRSDRDLSTLNRLVQEKIEETKVILRLRLQSRFNSCTIRFVDVPALFIGGETDPTFENPSLATLPYGGATSLLPPAPNALVAENTVLVPHPQNDAFANYLTRVYSELGIQTVFIDSFDYGHVDGGNIHCVTHSLRVCRPRR